MRVLAAITLVVCGLIAASGCSQEQPRPVPPASSRQTLVFGLIPEQNVFRQLDRYEPLAEYLSRRADVKIELKILPRYGNIIDNFRTAKMDGAFFGSFTYALAHSKLDLDAVARPVGVDGTSTYYGLIIVRRDSGIRTAADMRGKRFVFVDKATTAGYLLPLEYFAKHGIKDYGDFLRETYFAGTHEDAIYDVLNRRADVGAAKNTVFNRLAALERRIGDELTVLERSPEVPENGLALRASLDQALTERIKQTLLTMHKDDEGRRVLRFFGALRFIETVDADYDPVYRYAAAIGLDLATYDYRND